MPTLLRHILFFICLIFSLQSLAQTHHVLIKTNYGNMKAELFDDTPKHRDEFLRLVRAKHFNGTLFYRCIRNFVIQGGSSDSRNAKPGQHIGYGNDAVEIDSEFRKHHYHRFGALCAPRQPDKINMLKYSDISQFYIVRGRIMPDSMLTKLELSVNIPIKKKLKKTYYLPHKEHLQQLKESGQKEEYNKLLSEIKQRIESEYFASNYKQFSAEQREVYTTLGGTPELDDEYTVFGQVIEGFDVLRKINEVKVDKNDRPLNDIRITIEVID